MGLTLAAILQGLDCAELVPLAFNTVITWDATGEEFQNGVRRSCHKHRARALSIENAIGMLRSSRQAFHH
jgi:hypothetical protein